MATVTLELTPDLGWINRAVMFNASLNPALIRVVVSSMVAATATRSDARKTHKTLVFDIDSVNLQIPFANAGKLGSGNGRWFFRTVDGADIASDISSFELITRL